MYSRVKRFLAWLCRMGPLAPLCLAIDNIMPDNQLQTGDVYVVTRVRDGISVSCYFDVVAWSSPTLVFSSVDIVPPEKKPCNCEEKIDA